MLRVCLKLQAARVVETVDGLNQSNSTRAGQIVKSDARRHAALESSREAADEIKSLKDCGFSVCALTGSSCGSISEFHFVPFLPVLFGAAPAMRIRSFPQNERRGITHSARMGERSAAEGCTQRSEEEWRKPGETRVAAGRRV